jgi:hypothetical protein
MPVEVTGAPDQNPQKDGAEDDQKKRNFWSFPLTILDRIETEAENNFVLVL